MAGRIVDTDKERVRDLNKIEAVVGEYVALKSAGGGNLKGLCPFHDEKSPSFNVRPSHGTYHCFGCSQGGDVFTFVAEMEHLSFMEAVERLADRVGYALSYVEGGSSVQVEKGTRSRLLAANKAAAEFFTAQFQTAEAETARNFLLNRGFDAGAAARFGCGYAPGGWDQLVKALTAKGFSLKELYTAGLAREGQRGPIDNFNRRLLWQIRDAAGDVVGFGARRIYDDDRIEAKYVNTRDTPVYHKSQVLYGIDLAKKEIVKQRRAVVVEGYTDVMAMHAAGVMTAVASCGTAFGDEHITVLRRFLMDSDNSRGEVIYTFDGDAAGQKAALKAFDSDQKFAGNTSIALAPDGMDPCDLRQKHGDAAVRDLVENKKPLFEFAITSTLNGFDLNTAEGRVAAGRVTFPMVAKIKDTQLRAQYVNVLAGYLGVEPQDVNAGVRRALSEAATAERNKLATRPLRSIGTGVAGATSTVSGAASAPVSAMPELAVQQEPTPRKPNPVDPTFVERESVKLALQQPSQVAGAYEQVEVSSFTEPAYARVHEAILAAGGTSSGLRGAAWMAAVDAHLPRGMLASLLTELSVEPLRHKGIEADAQYAGAMLAAMALRAADVCIRDLESALRRAAAGGDAAALAQISVDLQATMAYRRALNDRANQQTSGE
ncbi:DNA primase [Nakamurella antarctica]|uniref:DNA primase n=1 Tax=Nakamurella antarctica TaxID=1902245 RepID=A0A3G8ZX51_9ACTN|nr:DNA primase [Nakamurella antarctica]AZI58241.1 DNA primase [Nakamurella antarctica]